MTKRLQLGVHKRLSASESLPNETIWSGAARCEFVAFDKWLRRIGLQWSTSRLVRVRIVSDSHCDWLFGIILFSSNHLYQLQSRTSDSCAISLFHYEWVSLPYNEKFHFVVSTRSKTKCKHYIIIIIIVTYSILHGGGVSFLLYWVSHCQMNGKCECCGSLSALNDTWNIAGLASRHNWRLENHLTSNCQTKAVPPHSLGLSVWLTMRGQVQPLAAWHPERRAV